MALEQNQRKHAAEPPVTSLHNNRQRGRTEELEKQCRTWMTKLSVRYLQWARICPMVHALCTLTQAY